MLPLIWQLKSQEVSVSINQWLSSRNSNNKLSWDVSRLLGNKLSKKKGFPMEQLQTQAKCWCSRLTMRRAMPKWQLWRASLNFLPATMPTTCRANLQDLKARRTSRTSLRLRSRMRFSSNRWFKSLRWLRTLKVPLFRSAPQQTSKPS